MVLAPGYAHLLAIQFQYTLTVFWLRSALNRDTAPVLPTSFVTGDKFATLIKIVPRSRQNSIKFVPWRQKHVPNPPCTVIVLWPRWRGVPGLCPVLASGYAY